MNLCHNTCDPKTKILWYRAKSKLTSGDNNYACQKFANMEARLIIKKILLNNIAWGNLGWKFSNITIDSFSIHFLMPLLYVTIFFDIYHIVWVPCG